MENEIEKARSDLYLELAKDRLAEQDTRLSGFHTRAAAIMTVSVALIGAAGLLLRGYEGSSCFVLIAAAAFAAMTIFTQCLAIKVLKPSAAFYLGPDLEECEKHLSADWDLIKWVADGTAGAVSENDSILLAKGKALIFGYWWLALSAFGFLVMAVVLLLTS